MSKIFPITIVALFALMSSTALAVVISWSPPTTNTDGTALTDLTSYNLYKRTTGGTWGAPTNMLANVTSHTPSGLASGSYDWGITAVDSYGTESDFSNIVTTIIASPPVATNDSTTAYTNIAKAINVLSNDRADTGLSLVPSSVTINGSSSHGTVTANSDGTVTYKSVAGYIGNDVFAYTVKDTIGQTSNVATVTIAVSKKKPNPPRQKPAN